jgi:hypothetical protein
MKVLVAALIGIVLSTSVVADGGVAGTWRGESICTVKNSPCHNEQVVYHVTEPDRTGKLKIQADKIVNGKADDMGTLDCTYDSNSSKITCPIPKAVFEFVVSGTKLTGTLKLSDGTLYRRISLSKE